MRTITKITFIVLFNLVLIGSKIIIFKYKSNLHSILMLFLIITSLNLLDKKYLSTIFKCYN